MAAPLAAALGVPFVVDNRPGAGANLGAELAARAQPDGQTLLLANISHATSVSLYDKLNYDALPSFDQPAWVLMVAGREPTRYHRKVLRASVSGRGRTPPT
jgi:tripartite-type tricarboxylate transporter receptor subunit TctC